MGLKFKQSLCKHAIQTKFECANSSKLKSGSLGKTPFKQSLAGKLQGKLNNEELALLPKGFQQLGHVVLLKLKPELQKQKKQIALAAFEVLPRAKTICLIKGIKGEFRKPVVEWLAGEKKFEVIIEEQACKFKFDCRKIMWSKGNVSERQRIASIVKNGEIVMDFFAGIGYWSIPIAKKANASKIIAFEKNPEAVKWLKKNLELNKISEGKVKVVFGDCSKKALKFPENSADRILLGLIPTPFFALQAAFKCAKHNGILHFEGTATEGKPEELFEEGEKQAEKARVKVKLLKAQKVKDYAPRVLHYTLDIQVLKE